MFDIHLTLKRGYLYVSSQTKNNDTMKKTFVLKKITGEYFVTIDGKTGIVVKRLSKDEFLLPTDQGDRIFTLDEIEKMNGSGNYIQLPFIFMGIKEFPSKNSMSRETFTAFIGELKKAFGIK